MIHLIFLKMIFNRAVLKGVPNSSVGKESACSAEDLTSIPGSGRAPGEGIGYPVSVLGLPVWLSW